MEAAHKSAKKLGEMSQTINPFLPETKHQEPFSRKALWALISTSGVSCVLNGMRHPVYVEDSLTPLQWELHPNPRPIFESFKQS